MAELIPEEALNASRRPARNGIAGLLDSVVTWWSLAGGLLFCAIVVMSIISIVGRKLYSAPIEGDMELLMMGAAVGSAAFLPLCEMHDHHIKVESLTNGLGVRGRAWLDVIAHGLLTIAAGVIAWRTLLYAFETHENMGVSLLLLVPLWQPVMPLVPSFVLLTLAAFYRTAMSFQIASGGAQ